MVFRHRYPELRNYLPEVNEDNIEVVIEEYRKLVPKIAEIQKQKEKASQLIIRHCLNRNKMIYINQFQLGCIFSYESIWNNVENHRIHLRNDPFTSKSKSLLDAKII